MSPRTNCSHLLCLLSPHLLLVLLAFCPSLTTAASSPSVPQSQSAPPPPQSPPPRTVQVTTMSGQVRGLRQSVRVRAGERELVREVDTFLGIPYAKPPVGELRFARSRQIEPWGNRTVEAFRAPPSCFQLVDMSFGRIPGVEMWNPNTELSEDCLYLNLWVPANNLTRASPDSERLAVMVWIYGGGYLSGSSTLAIYDGRYLAAEMNVIVASMQYRVGALGFYFLEIDEAPGNAGIWDQKLALSWLHRNVGCFGGNAQRITLFGESAGASSVGLHLVAPWAKRYFSGAIMQSASPFSPWVFTPKAALVNRSLALAATCGCDFGGRQPLDVVARCMRVIDADTIVRKQVEVFTQRGFLEVPFTPVVDGYVFPTNLDHTYISRYVKPINLLLGVNKDEGAYFVVYSIDKFLENLHFDPAAFSENDYTDALQRVISEPTPMLVDLFNHEYRNHREPDEGSPLDVLDAIVGDYLFKCPLLSWAELYATVVDREYPLGANVAPLGRQPPPTPQRYSVYLYSFEHRTKRSRDYFGWPDWTGVMHGYEIDYVFGIPCYDRNYTQEECALSRRMMTYWTNFAKTGNPNKGEILEGSTAAAAVTSDEWPEFSLSTRYHVVLDLPGSSSSQSSQQQRVPFQRPPNPNAVQLAGEARAGASTAGGGTGTQLGRPRVGARLRFSKCRFWQLLHRLVPLISDSSSSSSSSSASRDSAASMKTLPLRAANNSAISPSSNLLILFTFMFVIIFNCIHYTKE